jgi:hypothetical protein
MIRSDLLDRRKPKKTMTRMELVSGARPQYLAATDSIHLPDSAKSRTYILRSVLPAKAIAAMATPSATLSAPVNNVNDNVDGQAFDSEGVMLDWKRSSSELGSMGLLFFILSLVLISGRSITDGESFALCIFCIHLITLIPFRSASILSATYVS